MNSKYVFILIITIVSSFFLSLASEGFKDKRNKNIEIDKKKNILSSIGLDIESFNISDIDNYFKNYIDTLIINLDGDVIDNISISDLYEIEYFYFNPIWLKILYQTKTPKTHQECQMGKFRATTLF